MVPQGVPSVLKNTHLGNSLDTINEFAQSKSGGSAHAVASAAAADGVLEPSESGFVHAAKESVAQSLMNFK